MKFEDWWREIWLFLKSNRVIVIDDKITTVLAQLKGSIAGIYVQKKTIYKIGMNLLKKSRDSIHWQEQNNRCQVKDQDFLTVIRRESVDRL